MNFDFRDLLIRKFAVDVIVRLTVLLAVAIDSRGHYYSEKWAVGVEDALSLKKRPSAPPGSTA